jgi:hypothetical protein
VMTVDLRRPLARPEKHRKQDRTVEATVHVAPAAHGGAGEVSIFHHDHG